MPKSRPIADPLVALLVASGLCTGCVTPSRDRAWIDEALRERLGSGLSSGDEEMNLEALLADGLTESEAVAIALTTSPAYRAELARLEAARAMGPITAIATLIFGGTLGLLVMAVVLAGGLREEFLPHFAANDFLMHWIARPGTSLEAVTRTADLARAELLTVPGVRNFGAHIGRAEVADEVVGPNFAELWISVDPEADLPATAARVREVVDGYPGVYRDVQTYLQERMREVLSGGSGIVVRLRGSDLPALRREAGALAARLESIDGIAHARPEAPSAEAPVNHEVGSAP